MAEGQSNAGIGAKLVVTGKAVDKPACRRRSASLAAAVASMRRPWLSSLTMACFPARAAMAPPVLTTDLTVRGRPPG
jgi:hypothetical protein